MSSGSEATGTSRELLVFHVRRDTRCGECQTELEHGSLLYLDGERAEPEAVRLAVVAHVRHVHTNYDRLLGQTGDRQLAREEVREQVDTVLSEWQQPARSGKQPHSVARA